MSDTNDEATPEEIAAWVEKINRAQLRDDVQEFMQVYNLGNVELGSVQVGYRQLGADFYAVCTVRREGAKRNKALHASAESRAGALEALASVVADFLYPVKGKKG